MVLIESSAFLHTVVPMVVAGQCVGLAVAVSHHNQKYKQWEQHCRDFRYPWDDSDDEDVYGWPLNASQVAVKTTNASPTKDSDTFSEISEKADELYEYVSSMWCDDGEYAQEATGSTGGSPSHHRKCDTGGAGSDDELPAVSATDENYRRKTLSPETTAALELQQKQRRHSQKWVNSRTYSMAGVETTLFWAEGESMMPAHVQLR
jgi:hypothetical protein